MNDAILPSEKIRSLLHFAEEQTAPLLHRDEQPEESIVQLEQAVIPAQPEDANLICPIAAAIDESERRIKAEEVRYQNLIINRRLYEYYMDPYDFKMLMRDASMRLVNFDPAWDLPAEACPLPAPQDLAWTDYKSNLQFSFSESDPRGAIVNERHSSEFACPKPPRRNCH